MDDSMGTTDESPDVEALFTVLGNAVSYVANEALLLAQYEIVQEDKFANLRNPHDDGSFERRLERVEVHLGGPPKHYLLRVGDEPPPADNYPYDVLKEVLDVFSRARKSVLRAHLFMAGSSLLSEQPDLMELPKEPGIAAMFVAQAAEAFWEHAEAAYIRLFSFWDRIGQVLDFAFFNIRKFDQNGFYAVMDRVSVNAVPMNASMATSGCWKRLRTFQTSEKDDGLKWLLQRRNLIVHSLHLHPVRDDEASVFKSQFNHLDAAHRDKLRPRTIAGEVAQLKLQLTRAADLFPDFLTLLEMSPSRARG
jgi:hypothetical protein